MTLSIDQITPSNQNRFTGVRLDRLVEHRDDETWLANALTGPAVHYVPLWRSRNLL